MATIISDTFTRADSSTLGLADTGQTWVEVSGNWGISSNVARSVSPDVTGTALAVIEAGSTEVTAQLELTNISVWSQYSSDTTVVVRYLSDAYYYRYGLFKYGTSYYRLNLWRIYAGVATSRFSLILGSTPADGSVITVKCCGNQFDMYLGEDLQGSWTNTLGVATNYGTLCGIRAYPGTVPLFGGNFQEVDNFQVSATANCATSVTYNCVTDTCVDPGDGNGTYATLAECLDNCSVTESFNCTNNQCVDPGDGSGTYSTLQECLDSGCGPVVLTTNFDAGEGQFYYVVPPVVDSGDELRSKVVKSGRVTSKRTNQSIQFYPYDVETPIVTADLESGNNSAVEAELTDNTSISQSPRQQVNCPNAVLSTVRVQGDDTGQTTRDRIDEIVVEVAEQGVRR